MIIISNQEQHTFLKKKHWVEDSVIIIAKDIMYVIYDDGTIQRYHVVDEKAVIKEIIDE